MCPRVPPLQTIDWREDNYLLRFTHKVESGEIYLDEPRREKLWAFGLDLNHNFIDLALIVSRINKGWIMINRIEELFVGARNREWTEEEEKEYETLAHAVDFFVLDVRTLLIYIVVFMDTLAKFLSWTIKAKRQPKSKSFEKFRKEGGQKRILHLFSQDSLFFLL